MNVVKFDKKILLKAAVCKNLRPLAGLLLVLLTAACEQPAGDSEGGDGGTPSKDPTYLTATFTPFYLGSSTSYLRATVGCKGYKSIEFTYQSNLTAKATFFKNCIGTSVVQDLPISQGLLQQNVVVRCVGYSATPTIPLTLPWNLSYNYSPPSTSIAGYGVSSGGQPMSGAGISIINNSVGEVLVGTGVGAGATARNGIQGSIDP